MAHDSELEVYIALYDESEGDEPQIASHRGDSISGVTQNLDTKPETTRKRTHAEADLLETTDTKFLTESMTDVPAKRPRGSKRPAPTIKDEPTEHLLAPIKDEPVADAWPPEMTTGPMNGNEENMSDDAAAATVVPADEEEAVQAANPNDDNSDEPRVCAVCKTDQTPQWTRGMRWSMDWLCRKCYTYHSKHVPDNPGESSARIVHVCVDCEGDGGSKVWLNGTRFGVNGMICNGCYTWRYNHNGERRPREKIKALHPTERVCTNCATTDSPQWLAGPQWGVVGKLCTRCYHYRRRYGAHRPKEDDEAEAAAAAPARKCPDCGTEDAEWRHAERWGLTEMLCRRCFTYRETHEGRARPSAELDARQMENSMPRLCPDCGEMRTGRFGAGQRWGLEHKICERCYAYRRTMGVKRPAKVKREVSPTRHCADCRGHDGPSGQWTRGTRWGFDAWLCGRCYSHRIKYNGQSLYGKGPRARIVEK